MASRAFAVLVEALNALTPKRRASAVLYGLPALNDGLVAVTEGLVARGIRCHLVVENDSDKARCRELAAQLGATAITSRHEAASLTAFLRARYVFTTHGFYPVRSPRRQITVNLWHGEFTKRLDSDTAPRSLRGTRTTATSPRGVALRSIEFDVPAGRVLLVGSPRNDRMLHFTKAAARERLGLAPSGRVLLWLPTYRLMPDGTRAAAPSPGPEDLLELGPWLEARDATLLVKSHPFAPALSPSGLSPRIKVLAEQPDQPPESVAVLMAASDCLITDFSSAWSDFLLLDRPIWIHWPDHAGWTEDGNLPLGSMDEWLPGPLTTDIAQLLTQLGDYLDDDRDEWTDRRATLRSELHSYTDAESTRRLLDALGVADPQPATEA